MAVEFLHTNDLHGHLSPELSTQLGRLRRDVDLYFDSGDIIRAGNLAIPLSADPAWTHLADELDCTASVPGNRESHVLPGPFARKLEGSRHPVLCANLRDKEGNLVLPDRLLFECNGVRVGVFGVMVPMVTKSMKSASLSAFLWDPPIPTAVQLAQEMRPQVDLLIALTHIGYRQDVELAKAAPMLDVILGGHSHTVLPEPELHGSTYLAQGGSHGRFVGRYRWDDGRLTGTLIPLRAQEN